MKLIIDVPEVDRADLKDIQASLTKKIEWMSAPGGVWMPVSWNQIGLGPVTREMAEQPEKIQQWEWKETSPSRLRSAAITSVKAYSPEGDHAVGAEPLPPPPRLPPLPPPYGRRPPSQRASWRMYPPLEDPPPDRW
jgi:hypothetical protein